MICIECNKEETFIIYKCDECENPICVLCHDKIYKGWIEAYGYEVGDPVLKPKSTGICCTKCCILSKIKEPIHLVKHPDSDVIIAYMKQK